ncbi:MAG: NAD-binding protein, partial [Oscillospiraceae bacterium]|nr:NAD-binding protein [Oscillospiraceae bacterium]
QGLDEQKVLDAISTGAAGSWQMSNMAPRMLKGDFDPGFFVKHFIKDLTIATDEATETNLQLPVSNLVKSLYESLEKMGYGNLGTQALYKYYTEPTK